MQKGCRIILMKLREVKTRYTGYVGPFGKIIRRQDGLQTGVFRGGWILSISRLVNNYLKRTLTHSKNLDPAEVTGAKFIPQLSFSLKKKKYKIIEEM